MTPDEDTESAPAKINLFLRVTGRRGDGYHLLDSLVVFAGVGDRLRHAPAKDLTLALAGPFAASLAAEADNLVLRAARALADQAGRTPTGALTLEKNLPVASGIGGGSADAAAVLRLLCRAWNLTPEPAILHHLALALGADVPVCLRGRPLRLRGIGETLTQAPVMPECGLLLVNPGVPLATAAVFRARDGGFTPEAALPERWGDAAAMATTLAGLGNDLEAPAKRLSPVVGEVLAAIAHAPACLLARMSGSGATCFGLFPTPRAAEAAAVALARPGWWSWGGGLAA